MSEYYGKALLELVSDAVTFAGQEKYNMNMDSAPANGDGVGDGSDSDHMSVDEEGADWNDAIADICGRPRQPPAKPPHAKAKAIRSHGQGGRYVSSRPATSPGPASGKTPTHSLLAEKPTVPKC